jgi:hypothetical protein
MLLAARPHYRSAYALALGALAAITFASGGARGQAKPDSDVHASMQCDRATEPGRVRCSVELRIDGGRTLSWADVEILALPDFASALKGRIGPQDALTRDAASTRWALGLVARRAGQGEARARVRLVACEAKRCAPVTVEVRAQVTVGG